MNLQDNSTNSSIKVSVCVVTYNQEKYIRECLQSIVDQETDFDFEVIVSDDCSTDGTRSVVNEFAKKYSDLVHAVPHEKNIGAFKNYRNVHRLATGEYVAHVDGDDCLYPGKLLKQVRYLDANENCVLVAHRMAVSNSNRQVNVTRRNPQTISLEELLLGHPLFLNSSIMYRRDRVGNIFFANNDFIDYYVYVNAALRGDIGFLNDILGRYLSNVGISSKRDLMPYIQEAINLAEDNLPPKVLDMARAKQYLSYAVSALKAKDYPKYILYIGMARNFNKNSFFVFALFKLKKMFRTIRFSVLVYKNFQTLVFRFNKFFKDFSLG